MYRIVFWPSLQPYLDLLVPCRKTGLVVIWPSNCFEQEPRPTSVMERLREAHQPRSSVTSFVPVLPNFESPAVRSNFWRRLAFLVMDKQSGRHWRRSTFWSGSSSVPSELSKTKPLKPLFIKALHLQLG